MKKLRVGILFGGISAEKEISLKSGQQVFTHIPPDTYEKIPIFMDSEARLWQLTLELLAIESTKKLEEKLEKSATKIPYEQLKHTIDIAFPIFHGRYGEDGTIQGLLELLKIPFVGSGIRASANGMHKITSKTLYRSAGLLLPADTMLTKNQSFNPRTIANRLGLPVVVKPCSEGSSVGVTIVQHISQLQEAIEQAFLHDHHIIIEEYIEGLEITGGVFGNEEPIGLPIIEIVPKKQFFDFEAKYDPLLSDEICPARISKELTQQAQEIAVTAHVTLGCRTFSRTDMIICSRDQKMYVLETNTLPGMTAASLLPKAAKVHGWNFSEFLDRAIQISL